MSSLLSTQAKRTAIADPGRADAVTFLTIYLVLTYAVPSYLTIPALGSVGRLSVLWGLVGIAWWTYFRLQLTSRLRHGSISVKTSALVLLSVLILSYAVACLRGVPSADVSTADSSLIRLASWAGVCLVAIDGISSKDRLFVLLRRLVVAGALMALLGLIQFLTGHSLVDSISFPGFQASANFDSVLDRGGFIRSAGTAAHPLEYGSVLCATLPLAAALGIAEKNRSWYGRWLPVFVLCVGAALSMSRSALIGIFIGVLLLAPALPRKFRLKAVLFLAAMSAGLLFLVPGMVGTIRGLFLGIGSDASTVSRTDSAMDALQIAVRNPIFGRGFGTFLPQELILDNQMIMLLIDSGVLGLLAFLIFIAICIVTGWRVSRLTSDPQLKIMGSALSAAIAACSATLVFFDGLSFPITAGLLFLVLGISGASMRVARTIEDGLVIRRPDSRTI